MNNTDLIALFALITAIISIIISIKSYLISKQQHDDKYRNIIGYLIDSYKWKREENYYASFAISYTNNATDYNSFKDIVLEIEYHDENGIFVKVKIAPFTINVPFVLRSNFQEISIPINLEPKETKSGWVTFKLPSKNEKKLNIDSYKILATSTNNEQTIIESFVIKMVTENE